MPVAPYPYHRLPKLSRGQVAGMRDLALRFSQADVETALATARRLLGAPCHARWGVPEPATAEHARGCVGLVLDDAHDQAATTFVLMPSAFAHSLTDRVLGGEGQPVHAATDLDPWSTGALGYLAARVLAALQSPLSLRDVIPRPLEHLPAKLESAICQPLQLTVANTSTWVALWLFNPSRSVAPRGRIHPPYPTWLYQLPMTLVAECGRAVITRGVLEALDPDDIVIPENCKLRHGSEGFSGLLTLRFSQGLRGRFELLSTGNALRYQGQTIIEEDIMTDDKSFQADALEAVVALGNDAPVPISVEIARFTLPLGEIASLQAGDTFSTRSPIGAQVTLRASGVPIAMGELVDIDGETGVRILEVVSIPRP